MLYLSDVGLLRKKFHLEPTTILLGNRLFTEFKGILSENFVLCSLVRQLGGEQFYWASGNTAELEFIIQLKNEIVPIEVKSAMNITAKSLSEFRKKYLPTQSIRFSTRNLQRNGDLLNIPLYLVDRLREIG